MCMFVRTNTIKNVINMYYTFTVYLAISKKTKKANYMYSFLINEITMHSLLSYFLLSIYNTLGKHMSIKSFSPRNSR